MYNMEYGSDRHFEYKGEIGGITVIDDCAQTPDEVSKTLAAAQALPHGTLWIVFQPCTYSRTKELMDDFAQVLMGSGKVILTPIYPAGEMDRLGISAEDLQARIIALGEECCCFSTFDEIEIFLLENCTNGDLLITMGAGDVHKIGKNLLGL